MSRLTRKTDGRDYYMECKAYELMQEHFGNSSDTFYENPEDYYNEYPYQAAICGNEEERLIKLGKLEDIEEELGCPLEVVFKALKEGIYCVDYDNQIIRKFQAPLCFNSTSKQFYWSGNNIGYPDLKDYQKTWWLKGEKYE